MNNTEARIILIEIAHLLERDPREYYAILIKNVLSNSNGVVEAFLISNELWGGSGSIADQSLIGCPDLRKELESLLIRLGKIQLNAKKTNVRTESWIIAFESWRNHGLR